MFQMWVYNYPYFYSIPPNQTYIGQLLAQEPQNKYYQTEPDFKLETSEKIKVQSQQSLSSQKQLPKNSENLIAGILSKEDMEKLCVPRIKKIWSPDEDTLLMKLVKENDENWQVISRYFQNKSAAQCLGRYKRIRQSSTKRKWTKQQDQKIKQCVQMYGFNWKSFSPHFQNRTSKQIRQRYLNYLKPNIIEKKWEFEQDLYLSKLVQQHGKKWKLFQKHFPQRSENKIKNRYYGHIERILKLKQKEVRDQKTRSNFE